MSRSHEWFFYCLHRWRVRPHEIKEKDGSFVGGDSHLERRWSAAGARASHTTLMKLFIAITTSAAAIQSDPGRISREDGIPAVLDCRCLPPQPCRPCVWPLSTMSSGWNFWRWISCTVSGTVSAAQAMGNVMVEALAPPAPERTDRKTFPRMFFTDHPLGQAPRRR